MKAILEKISHNRNHSFALLQFKSRRFSCPFHYHPEIELTWIVNSSGHRYVGDHIGRFTTGDLVLMGPNLPHSYINDSRFSGSAHSIVLQYLPECLGPAFFQLEEMKGVYRLLARSRLGLLFNGRVRDRAVEALAQLTNSDGVDRLTLFLKILQMLSEATDYRTLASLTYSPSLALYQGERINRVCELISRKYRDPITQSDAATIAHMSPPSFSRFFKRATNKTFRGFLNEVRIGHASQQLLETDRPVTEVCYDSGFANLSNFNRQFLKLRRMSPRDYRLRAKTGNPRDRF